LILIICLVLLDVITSIARYRKHYSQTDVTHPLLETVHNDYVVNFKNNSSHKMEEFNGKVKLIYWHSGCPSSFSWFPKIEKIAKQYSDSLEIFVITNQSSKSLDFFTNLNLSNFNFCKGNGRAKEKRFKHHHSSHLVILDKNNILRAYGYQLSQTDSIIKFLVQNQDVPKSLQTELLFEENTLQYGLKNINNLNFQVTNYNENFQSRASFSTNKFDCTNFSIQNIYSTSLKIPNYRIINLTNGDLNGKSNSEKYCVYYQTKSPYAPMIWQMFFDNRAKRAKVFTDDLKDRIDKEFGLKSSVLKKEVITLILKDIVTTKNNKLKKLSRKSEYQNDISANSDTTRWFRSTKTNLENILSAIEQGIEAPIFIGDFENEKYQIEFSILNRVKYTTEEILKDLENQGFIFTKEKREIEYLKIEKAAENKM
jgi:thiol-disulfide isomerase/thioredoxin